jgi:aldose 1-epimerase
MWRSGWPVVPPGPRRDAAERWDEIGVVQRSEFGLMEDGRGVDRFVLGGAALEVAVLSYGGTIQSVLAPNRHGRVDDVVLGFDDLAGYRGSPTYFGATIGRYANRIAGGRFTLEGVEHRLPVNDGPTCLHGGTEGFDKQLWSVQESDSAESVRLRHVSPDGDMGFPGQLTATVTFTVRGSDLLIDYTATADRPTVVNLTNHSYFNLAGADSGSAHDHEVRLLAGRFAPVDEVLIPTGELAAVAGTPMDFASFRSIGAALRQGQDDEQVRRAAGGFDHTWVVEGSERGREQLAAQVREPTTGRTLEVWTDQPGVQFYTGSLLDGTVVGKDGRAYQKGDAFCLETQHFPDSPNQPSFPSTVLRPGEIYRTSTVFRFGR